MVTLQTVVARRPIAGDEVTIGLVHVPRRYHETLECGCERMVTLRQHYGPGDVVALARRFRSRIEEGKIAKFDPVEHLSPLARRCPLHSGSAAAKPYKNPQVVFYRAMAKRLRRRAKQRGLTYP